MFFSLLRWIGSINIQCHEKVFTPSKLFTFCPVSFFNFNVLKHFFLHNAFNTIVMQSWKKNYHVT